LKEFNVKGIDCFKLNHRIEMLDCHENLKKLLTSASSDLQQTQSLLFVLAVGIFQCYSSVALCYTS